MLDVLIKGGACQSDEVSDLQDRVRSRLSRRVLGLRVVIAGPGVVLRGRTCTYYVKQLAQHAVMETTDLPIIANEIEVSRTSIHLTGSGEPSAGKATESTSSKESYS